LRNLYGDEKPKRIFKYGSKNKVQETDYVYPLIAWSPEGDEAVIIYKRKDQILMNIVDIGSGKMETVEVPGRYNRILSVAYMTPGRLVFTAVSLGISDVFTFNMATRGSERITNDFYDYKDANYISLQPGVEGIVFASNRIGNQLSTQRLDTIWPTGNYNLFLYTFGSNSLLQLTDDQLSDNVKPSPWSDRYFSYLSERNGVSNRYIARIDTVVLYEEQVLIQDNGIEIIIPVDSVFNDTTVLIDSSFVRPVYGPKAFSYPNTDLSTGIVDHHISQPGGLVVSATLKNKQLILTSAQIDSIKLDSLGITVFKASIKQDVKQALITRGEMDSLTTGVLPEEEISVPIEEEILPDTGKIDVSHYFFQSDFQQQRRQRDAANISFDNTGRPSLTNPARQLVKSGSEPKPIHVFNRNRIVPYRLTFKNEYINTRLDNSLLFDGLESFAGDGRPYGYQPPGLLIESKVKDIFEDYEFHFGARVSTSLTGLEYFFVADNLRQRLNRRFAFYRHTRRFDMDLEMFSYREVVLPGVPLDVCEQILQWQNFVIPWTFIPVSKAVFLPDLIRITC
jgi:hypothetical protein